VPAESVIARPPSIRREPLGGFRVASFRRLVHVGAGSGLAVTGLLAAELLWAAFRPLPSMIGLDASGLVPAGTVEAPLRIVALGDSSLTGPGLAAAEHVWLRVGLDRLGHDEPIDLLSLAVGGSRAADVDRRVDEALAVGPDLVVVAVGANDALRGTPRRQFRADFDRVIGRLLEGAPVVAAANVGDLGNIARVPRPLNAVFHARARSVCSIIEDVVASYERAVLLDVTAADHVFRDRTVFTPDRFHPGPVGHAAWADAAAPGLRRAVELSRHHRSVAVETRVPCSVADSSPIHE
jgi:acyl-CoA thioesterase I